MPSLATLGLFSAACLALTMTPGPDMLLIASRSVTQGRSAGFASLAGIQVGTYCHAMLAAFGLSQLFLALPVAYDVVRFAGAAYFLYLAWRTLRASPMPCWEDIRTGLANQSAESEDGTVRPCTLPAICASARWRSDLSDFDTRHRAQLHRSDRERRGHTFCKST
jgi:threonine/homoserine/homoserine lactone efflux protein